jgi:hypothetical protein
MRMNDRNLRIEFVRVADLVDSPYNFRHHSDSQKKTLLAVIEDIGYYDLPTVFVNKKGRYQLVNGHMRKAALIEAYGPDVSIQVNVTDLTPDEAKVATATHDAISAMAGTDSGRVDAMIAELGKYDVGDGVSTMLRHLESLTSGVLHAPELEASEHAQPMHECPECGYQWTGRTR